jgi:hypothetical protein
MQIMLSFARFWLVGDNIQQDFLFLFFSLIGFGSLQCASWGIHMCIHGRSYISSEASWRSLSMEQ